MPRIDLSLSSAAGIAALVLLGCLVLSFFYYRTTLPPVSPGRRILLGVLRGSALFLTAFMLLEPLIRLVHTSTLPPALAVLIDNSESMTLPDRMLGARAELSAVEDLALPEDGVRSYHLFGSELSAALTQAPDSIPFDDEGTNLSAALSALGREAKERNLRAIVLLTDGSTTMGENPVYEAARLGLPVFSVGLGDSSHPQDIAVTKVQSNQTVYGGVLTPVDVTIRSSGFSGERIEVALFQEGAPVDRVSLQVEKGVRDHTVRLNYTPDGEGDRRLSVRVAELQGEETGRNNSFDFFVRVLKGRLRILVIGAAPSSDLSAIKSTLGNDPNLSVSARTQKKSGGYYEGPLLQAGIDSADCLILVGFPSGHTAANDLELVRSAIGSGTPVLFVSGPSLSPVGIRSLSPALGISLQNFSPTEELVFFSPVASGRDIPILDPNDSGLEVWNRLPPVFRIASRFTPLPGTTVLAVARIQGVVLEDPLLILYSRPPVKAVTILAHGLWRWNLMGSSHPDTREHLGFFLSSTLRWLTTSESDRGLTVRTTKAFYPQGEEVDFISEVYDMTARPVDDATVKVVVGSGDRSVGLSLSPIGNGRYEGVLHGLAPGEYRYRGTGMADGDTVGSATGRFSVGELNLEFRDTRMDAPLLRRLAQTTGGQLYLPGETAALSKDLESLPGFRSSVVEQAHRIELWSWPYTLAAILLLFAAEWILRKQSGMT